MTVRAYVATVGFLLLILAAALALIPVSTAGLSCGAVLFPSTPSTLLDDSQLAQTLCQSAVNTRAVWAAVCAGVGLLTLVAAWFVRLPERVAAA